MIISVILFSGSFPVTALLTREIHPISITLLRFLIAVVCLSPFVLGKVGYRRMLPKAFPKGLAIGIFYSGYFILMFMALSETSVINTGTLQTLTPLITAVMSVFIFKTRITRVELVAYLFGFVGTVWVIFKGSWEALIGLHLNHGDIIFICAAVCMSVYIIIMKWLHGSEAVIVMTYCTLVGGLVALSLALMVLNIPLNWNLLPKSEIKYIAYLAIGATLCSSYFIQKGSSMLTPAKVSAYIYVSPVLVVIIYSLSHWKMPDVEILPGIFLSVCSTAVLQKFGSAEIDKKGVIE